MDSTHGTDRLGSFPTKDPGRDSQGIDAHVQQGPTALFGVIHTLLGFWYRSNELTVEVMNIPNDATVDDLSQPANSICAAECIQSLGIMWQDNSKMHER